jgi:hypothetical protein
MGRLHAFEFNDQPWLPEALRRAELDYLGFVIAKSRVFSTLAPRLAALVDASGHDRIIDICGGGGGPYPELLRAVDAVRGRPTELVLTDLHPNPGVLARLGDGAANIRVEPLPVDARHVPPSLAGARTLFDGLHHFRPADARALLADAAAARAPILVAEASERSVQAVIACLLIPLFVILVMPLVRPRSLWTLLLTYVVPLVPLLIMFDGLISCLRTYRVDELRALTAGLDDGYVWEAGAERRAGRAVTWLAGHPAEPSTRPPAADV